MLLACFGVDGDQSFLTLFALRTNAGHTMVFPSGDQDGPSIEETELPLPAQVFSLSQCRFSRDQQRRFAPV